MWISERSESFCSENVDLNRRAEWLRGWVERLAVPRNFWAEAKANRRMGDLLAGTFESWGYDVHVQGPYRNIVALPPSASGEALTFVGAHYDSVPRCPGADDNASGVAVTLSCARELAGSKSKVGFIAFNGEEDGLIGSQSFVTDGITKLGILPAIVHVLEMVGCRSRAQQSQRLPIAWLGRRFPVGDFIGLVANRDSNDAVDKVLRAKTSTGPRCVALKQWIAMDRWLPDLQRADHYPFWQARIPSLLWSDTGNFRNTNYHRVTDTPDTLDYIFMAQVAELLLATLAAPSA